MKFLLLILGIAACVATTLLFITKGNIEEKEVALRAATEAHAEVKADLVELNAILAEERREFAKNKLQLESARSKMHAAKQGVVRLEAQLKKEQQQIRKLQIDLEDTRNKLVSVERRVADIHQNSGSTSLKEQTQIP